MTLVLISRWIIMFAHCLSTNILVVKDLWL